MEKDNNPETEIIPGMELDNNYSAKKTPIPESSEKIQKALDKSKKELEKLGLFPQLPKIIQELEDDDAQTE